MSDRILPREVHLRFVPNKRTGGTHNVLEVCGKNHSVAVRYVMAQDSETAKERDKYKLRAHLQEDRITELERALAILTSEEVENMALAAAERIATLESRIQAATEVYAGMEGFIPKYATEAYLFRIIEQMNNALLEKDDE